MSEMPTSVVFADCIPVCKTLTFETLRNNYLNQFAELETILFKVAKRVKCNLSDCAPMHQRLEGLKKTPPSSQLSKTNAEKLREILLEIDEHLRIRNYIVHSVMTIGSNGQSEAAFFQNAVDRTSGHQFHLILTVADFENYLALLNGFIRSCEKILINPPPSPPQPLRAVTAGP